MERDEPFVFVGMRVVDLAEPYVPSVTRSCRECGASVWVSKVARREAAAAEKILCTDCFLRQLGIEKPKL
jgi:hypothetical protein